MARTCDAISRARLEVSAVERDVALADLAVHLGERGGDGEVVVERASERLGPQADRDLTRHAPASAGRTTRSDGNAAAPSSSAVSEYSSIDR